MESSGIGKQINDDGGGGAFRFGEAGQSVNVEIWVGRHYRHKFRNE
jgi:hypothetical protein